MKCLCKALKHTASTPVDMSTRMHMQLALGALIRRTAVSRVNRDSFCRESNGAYKGLNGFKIKVRERFASFAVLRFVSFAVLRFASFACIE